MKKGLIVFLFLILFSFPGISAATSWVSPTGTATWTNCQSEIPLSGTACCSLSTANNNAIAGDTIYLRGGTYYITGSGINPINSGVKGAPITYMNHNDEAVEFVGDAQYSFAINLNSDYGTIRNYIHIRGFPNNPIKFTNFYRHLWILRGSYNEISHCIFNGSYDENNVDWRGSTIYRDAKFNYVHNNIFSDYGSFSNNDDNGILLEIGIDGSGTDNTSYNRIENNTFAHGGHHVLGVHGNHNIIRYNTIRNDAWWPRSDPTYGNRMLMIQGDLPNSQRNLFEYNRIGYGGETSETDQIGGSGGTWSSPNHIVRRNIFMHCSLYAMYFSPYNLAGPNNLKIYNNIYWHNGYSTTGPEKRNWDSTLTHAIKIPDSETKTHGNVFKNNIFYENKNIINSEWDFIQHYPRIPPAMQIIENNWHGAIEGNPFFVNIEETPDPLLITTQFDFNLQSVSGAIDSGIFLTFIRSQTGSGNTFTLDDASYFMDGWGIIDGDVIQLEASTKRVMITNIDYETNTIIVNESISWIQGQEVSLAYEGGAPDIGAHEYISGEIIPDPPTPPTDLSDIVTLQDMLGAYQQYKRNEVGILYFLDKLRSWIVFW